MRTAATLLEPHLAGHAEERLVVIALDRRRHVLGVETMTVGNDACTVVCPRQIFRWALEQGRSGAHAIILAHNHPSGNPTPSQQDIDITNRVAAAGRIVGIPLLDHIVYVDALNWKSLSEQGHLTAYSAPASIINV